MTKAPANCPQCCAPLTRTNVQGLCPACLLGGVLAFGGLAPEPEEGGTFPRRLGPYELRSVIARGGMGVVYRAGEVGLDREVALKMIAAADLAGPDEIRRFRVEAESAARLEHPNIIPIYAVGEHESRPYFAMKLAAGAVDGMAMPLENRAAAELLAKVAGAVHFAHERGILHRDLKPANILLSGGGEPMVADFGLAKLVESVASHTLSGHVIGTPAYMSPEQAREGTGTLTTASDVYSLGAILYYLLTGHAPFESASTLEVLRRVVSEDPLPPSAMNPQADEDLCTICLKCLDKSPAQRYASAAALAEDLRRWLAGEVISARRVSLARRFAKWACRRPAAATAAAIGTVAIAAGIVFAALSDIAIRHEKDTAHAAERIALAETARAAASARALRLSLYASDMAHARKAFDEGSLGVAREMLDRQLPPDGQDDLRGFEWVVLDRMTRGDTATVLRGHERAVLALAYSPDGGTLASGDRDGHLQLWPTDPQKPLRTLPRADAPTGIMEIPFFAALATRSPDIAAKFTADPTRLADMQMRSRPSKLGDITALAWSPDGTLLATASGGAYVRIWRVAELEMDWCIPFIAVTQVAFTPDGKTLIIARTKTGSPADGVHLYDALAHTHLRTIADARPCFAISRDGTTIFLARESGIEQQRIADGAVLATWEMAAAPEQMALSPDGTQLATILRGGAEVVIWATAEHRRLGTLPLGDERARAIAFEPDGATLLLTGTAQTIRHIDTTSFSETTRTRGHEDEVLALAVAPDGQTFASAGNDRTVRIWKSSEPLAFSSRLPALEHPALVSPDAATVLETPSPGILRVWDVEKRTATEIHTSLDPTALCFTPDSRSLLGIRRDGPRTFIEHLALDGNALAEPIEMRDLPPAWTLASITPTAVIFCVKKDGFHLYDPRTGALVRHFKNSKSTQTKLLLSPDGKTLATYLWPRRIYLWNLTSDSPPLDCSPADGTVAALTFTPDSRLFATGGSDNLITLWATASGGKVATLRGHKAALQTLAFTPDGRTLASTSADRTLRLWHTPTWRELGILTRGTNIPWAMFAGPSPTFFTLEPDHGVTITPGAK